MKKTTGYATGKYTRTPKVSANPAKVTRSSRLKAFVAKSGNPARNQRGKFAVESKQIKAPTGGKAVPPSPRYNEGSTLYS